MPKEEIDKRKKDYFVVYEENFKKTIFYYPDSKELYDLALKYSTRQEIKGTVASRTKEKTVKGKVRLIFDPSKQEFNKGDILVTSMTRVEFVPLMRKAKA